ncbi:type II toxin-antitoxin system RelE/ParE family toxin [Globicatella sanguinis]
MANYQIRILPSFEEDLNQIVDYIVLTLSNTSAAMKFAENVYKAIEERANYPLSFQPFLSLG